VRKNDLAGTTAAESWKKKIFDANADSSEEKTSLPI
jgi:hypothetical protein